VPRNSETSTMSMFEARSFGALVGSLLLLGTSFLLLVLAPQILARFHAAASETVPSGGFLPIAAASGIALGGGAAMIAVMARLVRDIEIRPYACLAPVLAVFAGYVMWGLRAQLPLESVSTEYVGVFAIAVSVAGGSLVAQRSYGVRGIGWALALFAPLALVGLLWASTGSTDPGEVLAGLTPQVKMYLGLLIGTALALGVIGEGARTLARRASADRLVIPGGHSLSSYAQMTSRGQTAPFERSASYDQSASYGGASAAYGHSAPIEEERLFDPPHQHQAEPEPAPYQPPPMRFDVPGERAPRVNVWEFTDDELTVPRRRVPWVTLSLVLALAGGAGGAFYYGVYMPKQEKEQAALQAIHAREEQANAAATQAAAQQRAAESNEAAARLEAAIGASGKSAAAAKVAEPATPGEQKRGAAAADAKKPAAPAAKAAPVPAAEPKKLAAPAPIAKAAPGPSKAAAAANAERKPADDGPGKVLGEGKGNDDPIYGL
jgi:hypothetical protein